MATEVPRAQVNYVPCIVRNVGKEPRFIVAEGNHMVVIAPGEEKRLSLPEGALVHYPKFGSRKKGESFEVEAAEGLNVPPPPESKTVEDTLEEMSIDPFKDAVPSPPPLKRGRRK